MPSNSLLGCLLLFISMVITVVLYLYSVLGRVVHFSMFGGIVGEHKTVGRAVSPLRTNEYREAFYSVFAAAHPENNSALREMRQIDAPWKVVALSLSR